MEYDTLNTYLNNLNTENFTILENKDSGNIVRDFKQILSKFKPSGKNKPEAKKKIKEIQKSENYKKVQLALKNSTKGGGFDESRFKKEILDLCDYTQANFLTILLSVFLGFRYIQMKQTKLIPVDIIAILISSILALPGPIIVKLITKTERKLVDIQTEIMSYDSATNKTLNSIELILPIILLFGSLFSSVLGGSGVLIILSAIILSVLVTLGKFIFGIYLGVKLNNWKYYDKQIKQKSIIESNDTNIKYIDTLIFISSLRENLVSLVTTIESKDFILNQASDYEILHFVVEGKFPEHDNENYEDLIEILNISLNTDFIGIDESFISTKGITTGILLETILNSSLFTNQLFLSESKINPNTLSELEKLMKQAKKNMANAMKAHLEKENEKTKNAYTDAGTAFNNAKERYRQYKDTGLDPGNQAFSNSGGIKEPQWAQFIQKIFTFDPSVAVKNILSKIYGASNLAKAANISPALSGALIALTSVVVSATFIFASYKAYQRLMGKAASFCRKEKMGKNTIICMKKFELKGVKERIIDLKKVLSFCDKLEKTEKQSCVITIKSKINSLEEEMKDLNSYIDNKNF